jgi:hypothetical protein
MTMIPSVVTMTMKIEIIIQVPAVAAMVVVDIAEAAVEVIALAEREANFKAGREERVSMLMSW